MSSYYISVNGNQTGPFEKEEIKAKARSGETCAEVFYWKDGMEDWRPISEIVEVESDTSVPPYLSAPADAKPKRRSIAEAIILFLTGAVILFLGFLLNATRSSLLPIAQSIHEDKYSRIATYFYDTSHLFTFTALAAILPIGLGILSCFWQLPRILPLAVVWLVLS